MNTILFREIKQYSEKMQDTQKISQYTIHSLKELSFVLQQRLDKNAYVAPETIKAVKAYSYHISKLLSVLTEKDLYICDKDFLDDLQYVVGFHIRNPDTGSNLAYMRSLESLDIKINKLINNKEGRYTYRS